MQFEYECALTGVVEQGSETSDSDGLEDLPVGWTKITMQRRQYNPKWVLIQQVKEAMVTGLLQQFPEEVRAMQQYAVSLQVEAQFHSLEADTPMYVADVNDVVFLSDSGAIVESVNELRDMLGLEAIEDDDLDDEEEEDGERLLLHEEEAGDSEETS